MYTRRRVLRALLAFSAVAPVAVIAAVPVAILAGCGVFSSSTTNKVTTITVNVAELDNWGTAFVNAATLIAGLPGIMGTPVGDSITAMGPIIQASLSDVQKSAGSSATLTFDATSVPTAVQSLLTDGTELLHDAQAALPLATAGAVSDAKTYIAALQTIVSLFAAEVASTTPASAAAAAPGGMTEAQALATLHIK